MSKENKEAINEAKEVLKEISSDARERRLAELRLKYIMDQKAVEEYGYDNGYDKGIEEGKSQRTQEIAKEMLKQKYTIEEIMSITGLSKEELEKIK